MPNSSIVQARVAMCRRVISMRKVIGDVLGDEFCRTPRLDMLFDLYLAEHDGQPSYLWSLCIAARIPISTAHRKIGDMERRGLVEREPEQQDRRRIGVKMTDNGLHTIERLLDSFVIACNREPTPGGRSDNR